MKTILVTGVAGFIGTHFASCLLENGLNGEAVRVVGVDNLNDYYDVGLKRDRLNCLADIAENRAEKAGIPAQGSAPDLKAGIAFAGRGMHIWNFDNAAVSSGGSSFGNFTFIRGSIADDNVVETVFSRFSPSIVVNLAAQAGVRYSIENPRAYIESNVVGFFNILEACRHHPVDHLVYASSSSVYGSTSEVPYSVGDAADLPESLYAATKRCDELLARAYSKLYRIPATGLRFFTVYGPYGRPDMAYFKFTDKIVRGEPIQIYNFGDMRRDFTYVDDIVKGLVAVVGRPPKEDVGGALHAVYNIGNSSPSDLLSFVETLERVLIEEGVASAPTKHVFLPMQPGDVYQTYADISALERDFGFRPETLLEDGLRSFARWYKSYHEA